LDEKTSAQVLLATEFSTGEAVNLEAIAQR
jgi:hypothetical protein